MLKSEKLDFAFTTTRNDWAESITVMKQPLYLAVPLEHPLAKQPSVTFTDFMNEPLIVLDKGTSLRTQFDQAFKERGAIPNIVFEVHECNAALQYVALNFGVSLLPSIPAMKTERVAAIPIAESRQRICPHCISYLEKRRQSASDGTEGEKSHRRKICDLYHIKPIATIYIFAHDSIQRS